jgi:glyoxylase-like metal-dependent hydrolase (beta-lactamase superfamily II)
MYFRQILHEEKACASYLVGCPTLGLCAVVDPQGDPQFYVEQAENNAMVVSHIIETHLHADHVSCARELAALTGAPLYLGPGAEVNYDHALLADGQVLEVGNRRLKVIHTPGHTPEHICVLGDEWYILTGDTLFVGDVGRVDLALNDIPAETLRERAGQLHHSLNKLLALPEYVEVYPGHYAGSVCGRGMDGKTISTIGRERRANPALQLSAEAFAVFQTEKLPALPADFQTIKRRNLGYA